MHTSTNLTIVSRGHQFIGLQGPEATAVVKNNAGELITVLEYPDGQIWSDKTAQDDPEAVRFLAMALLRQLGCEAEDDREALASALKEITYTPGPGPDARVVEPGVIEAAEAMTGSPADDLHDHLDEVEALLAAEDSAQEAQNPPETAFSGATHTGVYPQWKDRSDRQETSSEAKPVKKVERDGTRCFWDVERDKARRQEREFARRMESMKLLNVAPEDPDRDFPTVA